jgi:preprotein translocase subunit SecD
MDRHAFVVSFWLVAVVAGIAESPPVPTTVAPFQMRLVSSNAKDDTEEMSYVNSEVPKKTQTLHVQKAVLLDQTSVEEAFAEFEAPGIPVITLVFTVPASDKFAEIIRDNIGERLAIVIDGKVVSAPVLKERITAGVAKITGAFTLKEAQGLAAKIMASVKKP